MKKIIFFYLSLIITASCEFGDTNVSPATPADVSASAIIPSAQTSLAWVVGGELVRLNGLFMQYYVGINAQQAGAYKYLWRNSDSDGIFFRMYISTLQPFQIIIDKSTENDSKHIVAMSKIMLAHGIGSVTDIFGDVPFSQALKATSNNIQPTYDTQESVYTQIHELLDEAIVALDGANGEGPALGSADLIFSGDTDKWKSTAYALKAKYYIRTTKVNTDAYSDAMTAISNAISSNEDDFQMSFGTGANEANPAYQFSQDRGGNINFDSTLFKLMRTLNDPRRSAFYNIDTAGYTTTYDRGTYYTNINSPVVFASFAEMKFLEAEIELMGNDDVMAATTALKAAITASISKLTDAPTAEINTYVDANSDLASLATNEERLEKLIEQKYIALYCNGVESWCDYRRTGFPTLTAVPNGSNSFNLNGEVPRRVLYPQTEKDLNTTNVPAEPEGLQGRVWWDPS